METKKDHTVMIAVITGIIALLLGLCLGAVMGGAGGYLIGRGAAPRATIERSLDVPSLPQPTPRSSRPALPTPKQVEPEATQVPEQTVLSGALVREVVTGAPAANAGIKTGDIITEVDGQQLDANHKLNDLIAALKPGDQVELTIWRKGDTQKVTVELGAKTDDKTKAYLGIRYSDLEAVPLEATPAP